MIVLTHPVTDPDGETSVPIALSPQGAFADNAAASLAPVARELERVRDRVSTGELRLGEDAAQDLLVTLSTLQSQVRTLVAESGEGLGQPLPLGDNLVGTAMSERLRGAASGDSGAAIPVLEEFNLQLERLGDIVRRAAGLISASDDDARERLGRIGEVE